MKSLEANMTNRKTEYGPNNFQRMIRVALVLFMNWYAFPNYYHNTHGNLSQLLPVFSIIDALLLIWISKRLNLFAEADRLRIVLTYLWLKRFEKITEIPYASITGFYWKKRYRNGPVLKISTETNGQKDEMNIPAYDVADLRGLADALSQRLNIEVKESWFI